MMLGRLHYLFGGGRKRTLSKLIPIAIIGITFVLIDDAFRAAPSTTGARASRPRPDADDATVFRRPQNLLETVPPVSSCRHQHRLGGRCLFCKVDSRFVRGQVDGPKPTCLDWLRHNCSVLSFGINNDFSFDDAMADLGCTVHAFDPSMGRASFRRSERVHFHNVGIAEEDGQTHGFPVVSLGTAARRAGMDAGVIDYLKLDVESSEWQVLAGRPGDLRRVIQLAVEFHLYRWTPSLDDGVGMESIVFDSSVTRENALRFVEVLNSLQSAGFVLTHTDHGSACQNYTSGCLPFLYETVWVNTRLVSSWMETPSTSAILV